MSLGSLDAVGDEDRRSNYKAAIAHSTEVIAKLRNEEEYESLFCGGSNTSPVA